MTRRPALLAAAVCVALLALVPPAALARGDVSKATGNVTVREGEQAGDVGVLSGNVTVFGRVAGDVGVANGSVTVMPGGRVGGNVSIGNGNIDVARGGRVGGDAQVANGDIRVVRGGLVVGNARTLNGAIRAPAGAIGGARDTGTDVLPEVNLPNVDFNYGFGGWAATTVLALLFGALTAAIFPGFLRDVARRLVSVPWISPVAGIGAIVAAPIVAILLVITVVGLLILPFWLVAVAGAWIAGWFGAAYLIGNLILRRPEPDRGGVVLATVLGIALLRLVALVPIFGWVVNWAVALFGFGAIALLIFRQKGEPSEKLPVPA